MSSTRLHEVGQFCNCHTASVLFTIDTNPADRFAVAVDSPDHHVLRLLRHSVGVVNGDAVVCPVWVKVEPVSGLNCPSGGSSHVS